MPTSPPPDRAALARERLAARARRLARIRRGVAAGTLSAVVLAWGVIAHSGSMGAVDAAAATTSASTSGTSSVVTDGGTAAAATTTDDAATTSDDAAALTTRQS